MKTRLLFSLIVIVCLFGFFPSTHAQAPDEAPPSLYDLLERAQARHQEIIVCNDGDCRAHGQIALLGTDYVCIPAPAGSLDCYPFHHISRITLFPPTKGVQ